MATDNATLLLVLVIIGLVVAAAAVTALVGWALVAVLAPHARRSSSNDSDEHDVVYSNGIFELGEISNRQSDAAQID